MVANSQYWWNYMKLKIFHGKTPNIMNHIFESALKPPQSYLVFSVSIYIEDLKKSYYPCVQICEYRFRVCVLYSVFWNNSHFWQNLAYLACKLETFLKIYRKIYNKWCSYLFMINPTGLSFKMITQPLL